MSVLQGEIRMAHESQVYSLLDLISLSSSDITQMNDCRTLTDNILSLRLQDSSLRLVLP